MSSREIYLDHAATTPVDPVVADTMTRIQIRCFANPSSPHAAGRRAYQKLDESRTQILKDLKCPDATLIFTSGATEANYLALYGIKNQAPTALVTSQRDHESLRGAAESLDVFSAARVTLPLDQKGCLCTRSLNDLLFSTKQNTSIKKAPTNEIHPNIFLSTTLVCGQTGTIENMPEIHKILNGSVTRCTLHVDATQAVGKIPISFTDINATSLTFAPHKFGGPRGIGCLIVKKDAEYSPVFPGPQQFEMRGGTEPLALIAGCQKAVQQAVERQQIESLRLARLKDTFESIVCEYARRISVTPVIVCQNAPRSPHITTIAFPGIDRQAFMMAADLEGIAVATGTACASGSQEPAPALIAINLSKPVIQSAIRFSFGYTTIESDLKEASERICQILKNCTSRHLIYPR
ncbi:MAG: aminotransferase class V-fold PLP-dependent enzyme [Planctomycetaceae bacterium]|nr:aminotransferase class V-fold PLP-dependent enzyme [Planctomycetaceae bacterium]